MPVACMVAPANKNEKRNFREVAAKVRERFPNTNARPPVQQRGGEKIHPEDLKDGPVNSKRRSEKGGPGEFRLSLQVSWRHRDVRAVREEGHSDRPVEDVVWGVCGSKHSFDEGSYEFQCPGVVGVSDVVVCTVKGRRSSRWRNTSYKFVTLVDNKFFGFTMAEEDGCKICVAEPEKAVLDSLDKPKYYGGVSQVIYVVSNAINSNVDRDKLLLYADRMGSNSILQRLGYIVDLLSERGLINVGEYFLNSIMGLIPEGASYSYLGPGGTHDRKGPVEGRWKIIMNVDETTALSELKVK